MYLKVQSTGCSLYLTQVLSLLDPKLYSCHVYNVPVLYCTHYLDVKTPSEGLHDTHL